MNPIAFVSRVRAEVRARGEYKFGRWGSFWHRFAIAHWKWSAALCKFGDDDRWVLHLFCLWVTLARASSPPKGDLLDSWGFTFANDDRCLHLNWGHRTKILHYPWALEYVRTEHGMPDGTFVTVEQAGRLPKWASGYYRKRLRDDGGGLEPAYPWKPGEPVRCREDAPGRYRESFPYRYTLRGGEVQERTATVTVDRMTWCWRAFWRVGVWFPKKVRTSVWVEFSDEVGERTGSWKGGTVGCGYDLRPGETPEQALRRMEREREFN